MNLIEELTWRGMIQDMTPGTEEQLAKEMTTGYIGFDPTSDSLHIGSLVPILLLIHLQKAGHRPMALVGGATGMIGDPSGKSEERNLLQEHQLHQNVEGIRNQLSRFLDFNAATPNGAVLVNNYDWFKTITFIDFLRDAGKHITVNYMMSKDSVRKRIEGDTGISYTEFAYQLMQGYDFFWLYKNRSCKLQMGGSDQWGNILTGTELIRRKSGGEAFAFTCPLITKADGGKFGKTEKGNIWLDAAKTSPYQFYQFWLNAADADAVKWIRIFTFLDQEVIDNLLMRHSADAGLRLLQKALARELTIFVHGVQAYDQALETTEKLFMGHSASADTLSMEDIESMEGVVHYTYSMGRIKEGVDVVSFLAEVGVFGSKGEARKMILQGGVRVNRIKVADIGLVMDAALLLHEKYILVQKGKKNYYLVKLG